MLATQRTLVLSVNQAIVAEYRYKAYFVDFYFTEIGMKS